MQVKTFKGKSTREVLAKIKSELGKEAVILDSQTIRENGRTCCQITAAVDPPAQPVEHGPHSRPSFQPEWNEWQRDWSHFKENILSLLQPHRDLSGLNGRQRLILDCLEREGVSAGVLLELCHKFKAHPQAKPLDAMSRMISTRTWQPGQWPERFHALAGPHGAGKTSTCLRMALLCKRDHPDRKICLVNADLRQGKGRLFLRHYAELSDIHYLEASSPRDWALLSRISKDYDGVFIDLPGMSRGCPLDDWLRQRGAGLFKDLAVHLVLNPLYSEVQLDAYLKTYRTNALSSLIWTKIDEACTFGSMINAAHVTGLPASLLSCGSSIKDSLFPATERLIWQLLFRHRLPGTEPQSAGHWTQAADLSQQTTKARAS